MNAGNPGSSRSWNGFFPEEPQYWKWDPTTKEDMITGIRVQLSEDHDDPESRLLDFS